MTDRRSNDAGVIPRSLLRGASFNFFQGSSPVMKCPGGSAALMIAAYNDGEKIRRSLGTRRAKDNARRLAPPPIRKDG